MTSPTDPNRTNTPAASGIPRPQTDIKETLTSLTIAFALAFVFRGFVVEPFVIPTGSMAPTLLGAHERIVNPSSGNNWAVNPWFSETPNAADGRPLPRQGGTWGRFNMGTFDSVDPMTKEMVSLPTGTPLRSGDRIFVLRYVWPIFKPERYDVSVFKDPKDLNTNLIKRVVGMPSEQLALVDGDVFVRPIDTGVTAPPGANTWKLPGWRVAPKPERVQRSVWQPLFDSRFAPLVGAAGPTFQGPFVGGTDGWDIKGRASYAYTGAGATRLVWDVTPDTQFDYSALMSGSRAQLDAARHEMRRRWHLADVFPFDEIFPQGAASANHGQVVFFPVSDLRLSAGVEPKSPGLAFSAVVQSRGHEFRGRLSPKGGGYESVVEMRATLEGQGAADGWRPLDTRDVAPGLELAPGKVSNIEFWHVDQQLQLWVDDRLVASGSYPWSVEERIQATLGMTLDELATHDRKEQVGASGLPSAYRITNRVLASGGSYSKPKPFFELSGACVMHRVGVARDLFYQPVNNDGAGTTLWAAHPDAKYLRMLEDDEYFVCGDNSPLSFDARGWPMANVDPWVEKLVDPTPGVVNERLVLGKAFFVYFPAMQDREVFGLTIPMPDASRLRWIW